MIARRAWRVTATRYLHPVASAWFSTMPATAMRFGNKQVQVTRDMLGDGFQDSLRDSCKTWREEGTPGVWLKIPIDCAVCMESAAEEGFKLHHTEGADVMMCRWLKDDLPSLIQPYATHKIGVGGFVINADDEVLVVRESEDGDWKLPGGIADLGEEIGETAQREVKEETGIDTEFERLVGFRHQHNTEFGRSNLYFVALMRHKGGSEINMCESELVAATWMPIIEYMSYLDRPDAASSMNLIIARLVRDSIPDSSAVPQPLIIEHTLPVSRRSKGGLLYMAQFM